MGNIDTYVRDIGRKSFSEEPFNDVDNLIVSYLVYYNFDNIVPTPGQKTGITVADAARRYKETVGDSQKTVRPILLEDMGESIRFRDMLLSDRIDIFHKNGTQFSALCVTLPDGMPYVVFRGIDYSVTGWREAFQTSYMVTPAQKMAAEYLQRILAERNGQFPDGVLLGGHSKGGNLALYAAVHLPKQYRDSIRIIYQNDAPGLSPDSYDPAILREFKGRVRRFAPEFSVIDSVYKTSQADRLIKADAEGFNQHEPFYWVVEDNDFTEVKAVDPQALKIQKILRKWLPFVNKGEKKRFVLDLFDYLQKRADEGIPFSAEKKSDLSRLVLGIWKNSTRPARRAILRLGAAALETALFNKERMNPKDKNG